MKPAGPGRARGAGRRLPALPAAGRVARAGRAREAGRVPRRGLLGPAGPRASATRRRGCTCSASRPRRTAATAPAACSPATARATGCSRRCTAPASRTSPSRSTRTTACACDGAFIAAAVRCAPPANKPLPGRARQLPPLRRGGARADAPARGPVPGRLRVGRGLPAARHPAAAALRPRRRAPASTAGRCCSAASTRASRTPSPAADRADDRRRLPRGRASSAGATAPSGTGPRAPFSSSRRTSSARSLPWRLELPPPSLFSSRTLASRSRSESTDFFRSWASVLDAVRRHPWAFFLSVLHVVVPTGGGQPVQTWWRRRK